MIIGALAQQPIALLLGRGVIPALSEAHVDFIGQTYIAGGQLTTAAAILGGDFDPANIMPRGYLCESGKYPIAIGQLLTDLAAVLNSGGTLRIELDADDLGGKPLGIAFYFHNDTDPTAATEFFKAESVVLDEFTRGVQITDHDAIDLTSGDSDPGNIFYSVGIGPKAAAFTINAASPASTAIDRRYAISVSGTIGETLDVGGFYEPPLMTVARVSLFGVTELAEGMENIYVRSFTIFQPPVLDPYLGLPEISADASPPLEPTSTTLLPTKVNSDDAFFTHQLVGGTLVLAPSGLLFPDNFFSHSITVGGALSPSLYSDTDTFFTHVVFLEDQFLLPSLYSDADTFFTPLVEGDADTLLPALYSDTDTFFTHVLVADTLLLPSLYSDTDTFFTPVITGPTWTDTYAQALNGDSTAWNNNNLRQWFAAAVLSTSGSKVRLTIEGGSTEGAQISGMYIGHAAGSGDAWDFDGTQVPVTSGGNTTFTVGAGATLVLDAIDYAFDETKAFIVAAHFNNSAADNLRGRTGLGANLNAYFKAGASEVSVSNVGIYTPGSGNLRLINRIEVLV